MAQYFEIRKGSELPSIKMVLANDGKYDFMNTEIYNNAIQNADITFSMKDEKGVLKISKAKANIIKSTNCNCEESYLIEYKWKKKDTSVSGIYDAFFEITFKDDLYQNGVKYEKGTLIMPIHETLKIHII